MPLPRIFALSICFALLMCLLGACNTPISSTPARIHTAESSATPSAFPETAITAPTALPCLGGGDQNTINERLHGPGKSAALCPGALFELSGPVILDEDGQKLYTQGLPTGEARATLRIVARGVTTAIIMRDQSNAMLENIIVDGNRPGLGPLNGDALIYAGGFADGQVIRNSRIMNPRSWSSVHLIEGGKISGQLCTHALVEGNEIGPAGTSDNWADGISLACTDSTVRNNLIVDATDGAIVIFGAPGSLIEGNTIRAETRTLLGGINMVDYDPYDGNYTGTIVRNNAIDAASATIRIALGMGPRVWGCLPAQGAPKDTIHGGTVMGNTLHGDFMQYGFALDGVKDWKVGGNSDFSTHTGIPALDCAGKVASAPAGFQWDPAHVQAELQPEFAHAQLDLALWSIISPRPGE